MTSSRPVSHVRPPRSTRYYATNIQPGGLSLKSTLRRLATVAACYLVFGLCSSGCNNAPTMEPGAPSETSSPGYHLEEWGVVRFPFLTDQELYEISHRNVLSQSAPNHATWEELGPELTTASWAAHLEADAYDWESVSYEVARRPVEKPVIYFFPHTDWPSEQQIEVTVGLDSLELHEVWPLASVEDDTLSWTIRIGQNTCNGSLAPHEHSPHCNGLGFCEAAEMREYMVSPVPCVETDAGSTPALLYNGYLAEGALTTRPIDDQLLAYESQPLEHLWVIEDGLIRYTRFDPQGRPVEELTLQAGTPEEELAEFERWVRSTLDELGLRTADHFMLAWENSLFSSLAHWRAFGIYPRSVYDEVYPLDVTPAPTTSTRVLAFIQESREGSLALLAERQRTPSVTRLCTGPRPDLASSLVHIAVEESIRDAAQLSWSWFSRHPEFAFDVHSVEGSAEPEFFAQPSGVLQQELEECVREFASEHEPPFGYVDIQYVVGTQYAAGHSVVRTSTWDRTTRDCVVSRTLHHLRSLDTPQHWRADIRIRAVSRPQTMPGESRIEFGPVAVQAERANPESIRSALGRAISSLHTCFDADGPQAQHARDFEIELIIAPDGSVARARLADASSASEDRAECILRPIRAISFPLPYDDRVARASVTMHVSFTPIGGEYH